MGAGADAEARFVISIDGSPGAAGAGQVTSALEKLRAQIEKDTAALQELVAAGARLKGSVDVSAFERVGKDLQKAQAEAGKLEAKLAALRGASEKMQQGPAVDIAKHRALQAEIASVDTALASARERAGKLSAERERLGQTEAVRAYKDVQAAIAEKQKALAGAQLEATRLGGSLKQSADQAKKLGEQGKALRERLVSGLKIVAAAALAATLAVITLGFGFADSARSAQILREAATGSATGAAALEGSVNRVLSRTAATRGEVEGLALELRRATLEGVALESAVSAVTTATQVMGQKSAGIMQGLIDRSITARRFVLQPLELRGTGVAFQEVAQQLAKNMGIAVGAAGAALRNGQVKIEDGIKALDQAVQVRFGALARKQMLALPAQFARARDNLAQLFTGVGMDKFLVGLSRMLGMLDQSTENGRKLRAIVTKIFQPIVDVAMRVFPVVEEFFWGLAIGATRVYVVLREIGRTVADWMGFDEGTGLEAALELGELAAYAMAGALLYLAGNGIASLITALGSPLLGPLVAATAAFVAFNEAVSQFSKLRKEWDGDVFWRQVQSDLGLLSDAEREAAQGIVVGGPDGTDAIKDAQKTGEALGTGLVSGMQSQMSAVESAGAALASAASEGMMTAADMHSPSRVFREHGRNLGRSTALGAEDEAPRVSKTVGELVSPETQGGAPPRQQTGRGGVYIDKIEFSFHGGADPSKIDRQSVLETIIGIFEDAGRQVGMVPVQVGTV